MYEFLVRHVKYRQKKPKYPGTQDRWFTLPREIRDMIYREVLCKRYLIHWSKSWKRGKAFYYWNEPSFWFRGRHWYWKTYLWSGRLFMQKRPLFWADVSLLLTSKAISKEAIEIMYEGSVFCVYVGQTSLRYNGLTPLPSQHLLDRMQMIDIGTCVDNTLDFGASETWFKTFNASPAKRNTCRISFPCYYCLNLCQDEVGSHAPFFQACRSLVGFKAVTVTLDLLSADAEEEEQLVEVYNSMREDFKTALEPHLGPGRSYDVGNVFALEFRPRKYLEDLQAALPTSGRQALLLEEGAGSGDAA